MEESASSCRCSSTSVNPLNCGTSVDAKRIFALRTRSPVPAFRDFRDLTTPSRQFRCCQHESGSLASAVAPASCLPRVPGPPLRSGSFLPPAGAARQPGNALISLRSGFGICGGVPSKSRDVPSIRTPAGGGGSPVQRRTHDLRAPWLHQRHFHRSPGNKKLDPNATEAVTQLGALMCGGQTSKHGLPSKTRAMLPGSGVRVGAHNEHRPGEVNRQAERSLPKHTKEIKAAA